MFKVSSIALLNRGSTAKFLKGHESSPGMLSDNSFHAPLEFQPFRIHVQEGSFVFRRERFLLRAALSRIHDNGNNRSQEEASWLQSLRGPTGLLP